MLGLIVVATEHEGCLSPDGLLEDLLGVPVVARAIAGALPADEPVAGVLVCPEHLVDKMKTDVVERFGFDEIDRVIGVAGDFTTALRSGIDALGEDVDVVLVQLGAQGLAPLGLVERVVKAAREADGAAPAVSLAGHVVAEEDGALVPLDVRPRLRRVQGPQGFKATALRSALDTRVDGPAGPDAAGRVVAAGGTVSLVDGDEDNLLLQSASDLGRAVEVFSRRAVDYPFVYPKDLLPEDPLASALAPGEEPEVLGRPADEGGEAGA